LWAYPNLRLVSERGAPSVRARAAFLFDPQAGVVYYQKNADTAYPVAGLTKIMTLLLAMDSLNPDQPGFTGITIAELSGAPLGDGADARNAVVVSTGTLDWDRPATWTGAIDRSPCGTGTCAKMATLHARGQLPLDRDFHHEGVLGTIFTGRLVAETTVGPYRAVVPTLSGQGWITGFSSYVVDPSDPFPEGFTVGDIW
ncbi:MAG: proline racemase family protein, partial [Gemmatimonadaceae bacterium]